MSTLFRYRQLLAPRWLWLWLGLLSGGLARPARAQTKVQVVTRTVEQTFSCPDHALVRIKAEKATLRVQGWNKPTVQVLLRLVARHPERAVAEQELPAARYHLGQSGLTIDLMNYFAVTPGAPALRSDLRAEYTVMMPADAALEIVNAYGQTMLSDLSGAQKLEQDFGRITLQDLRGSLQLTIRYADLNAANLTQDFTCDADKSAVRLTGVAGRCVVRNRYGSVALEPAAGLRSAVVEAVRSEITLGVTQTDQFRYDLSTEQGSISSPAGLGGAVRKAGGRQLLRTEAPAHTPLIRAHTTYAPISLRVLPLLMKQ